MKTYLSLFSGVGGFDLALDRAGFRCAGQVELDRQCRRVLGHHWPKVPKHDDVTTYQGEKGSAGLLCGGFPCFPGEVLVFTKRGLVPIKDVKVGDLVFTHRNRWRAVTSVMRRFAGETLTLSGGLHFGLTTTAEHPFWASGGRFRKYKRFSTRGRGNWCDTHFSPPQWVEAKDMEGQYWSSPVLDGDGVPPTVSKKNSNEAVSPSLMWIIGYWVGDGWFYRKRGKIAGLTLSSAKGHTKFVREKLEEAGLRCCVDESGAADKVVVCDTALARWVHENFGQYCDGKKIPTWLLTSRREYREFFLDGYVWADGSDRSDGWQATTICRSLAVGVAILGRSLGWQCALYHAPMPTTCEIQGRTCSQRDQYQVRGRRFAKQTSAFVVGDQVFAKCRKVTRNGPQEVFNVSVEEDESYTADGVFCHNCQDLSVAGRRAGLAGERSGLFFEFARVVEEVRPRWVVVENVPGLLTSDSGRDMGTILGVLADLGYGWAYRVLDAQYFGLAQRRERVFVVGCLGDRSRTARVLFEPESVSWDPPPGREEGSGVAGTLGGGTGGRGWCDDLDRAGAFVPETARCVTTGSSRRYDGDTEDFVVYNPYRISLGKGNGFVEGFKPVGGKDQPTRSSQKGGRGVMAVRRLTPL